MQTENVCRAYADFYAANGSEVPHETQESRYFERLIQAYPIHPEVFDRLYEDRDLDGYLSKQGRKSRGFFKNFLGLPHIHAILVEIEEARQRWHEQHRTGGRGAFDRMTQMQKPEFAMVGCLAQFLPLTITQNTFRIMYIILV